MTQYQNPIEQLIHTTVRIECQTDKGQSSGSGYIYGFCIKDDKAVPCIITNKHVIAGATQGRLHLTRKDEQGNPKLGEHVPITFDNFEDLWIKHPDENIDLAVFPFAPILHAAKKMGENFYYIQLTKDIIPTDDILDTLPTVEDIIMIGYPNGIWDSLHNLPVVRRGITATHPKRPLNGKSEFLIDAACFPGSSGSPVFLANIGSFVDSRGKLCAGDRIALLGTLYAGHLHTATGEIKVIEIPTSTTPIAISTIPNNLGLVIHANKLLDFEPVLQSMLPD